MIRGYFLPGGNVRRPYVNALVEFPRYRRLLSVAFLVDTGADRTVLATDDLVRAGIDPADQPLGPSSIGAGGTARTRTIDAVVTMGSASVRAALLVFDADGDQTGRPAGGSSLPSLLGQDILSKFVLVVDPLRDRLVLLEPEESAALSLP